MEVVREFNIYLAIATKRETEALFGVYPNLLNSYWYFKRDAEFICNVIENTEKFKLDSGAFSAFTSGKCVYLDQYQEYLESLTTDKPFDYVMLDVIGDGVKTFAMYGKMLSLGLNPVPVFTKGSCMSILKKLCEMEVEKLCLGGIVGGDIVEHLDQCWKTILTFQNPNKPIKVHGLGLTNFRDMVRYPWYSVDSSSVSGCYRFGRAFQTYDVHNKRFGGSIHVHDYMRLFFPHWEDQPIGPKFNESIGVSPQCFLIAKQAELWRDAQDHLRAIRKTADFSYLVAQSSFFFMDAPEYNRVEVADDDLPLIAPPSARGGGMSIADRQEGWDFGDHIIEGEADEGHDESGVVAIDFETFYSTDFSVTTLGSWAYARDEQFKTYCIGAYGEGLYWCGPSNMFDWNKLRGKKVLAHNVNFERNVVERLVADGIAPDWMLDIEWIDTADLSAYFNYPRALDGAMKQIFGESLDKSVRDRLKSCDCTELEVVEYCVEDCRSSYRIYQLLYADWTSAERRISQETLRIGRANICVDTDKAERWIEEIEAYLVDERPKIPFDPPGSDQKAAKYLDETYNVEPPPNWQMKKPEYMNWKQQLPPEARAWVVMREDFKKARKILNTIRSILTRTDEDGYLHYELKYFGASTGRWSGSGGLNMQNWHRKARWNIRHLLVAPPGYVLGIHDFAQIEARSLLWLANDWDQLNLIRQIGDVYEAHARSTMGYNLEEALKTGDPDMRHLAKARVLALGYGCGDTNFQFMAKSLCDLDLEPSVCSETVIDYRETNSGIVRLWADRELQARACMGGNWSNVLPSGRPLNYRNIHTEMVMKERNGKKRREKQLYANIGRRKVGIYGGLLIENENQAFCRDIMSSAWLRCNQADYHPAMTIHDELVFLYPERTAERDLAVVDAIMSRVPAWCAGLPLEVEGELSKHYKK